MKLSHADSMANLELIYFEKINAEHIGIATHDILYGFSAGHYVQVLISENKSCIWLMRRISLKELMELLPKKTFLRLNRSCFVNTERLVRFEEEKQVLYFGDDPKCVVTVEHHIDKYIKELLRR